MRSQALGHDAVALVEHAGLNPMGSYSGAAAGRELKAPRAGCPKGNLRATLRALTDAGLSVVVLEEAQPEGFAAVRSRTRKDRYIAGFATPASPTYLPGFADEESDAELRAAAPPPIVGLTASSRGYSAFWINPDLREVRIATGLTAEAAASAWTVAGYAPPLYAHASLRDPAKQPVALPCPPSALRR